MTNTEVGEILLHQDGVPKQRQVGKLFNGHWLIHCCSSQIPSLDTKGRPIESPFRSDACAFIDNAVMRHVSAWENFKANSCVYVSELSSAAGEFATAYKGGCMKHAQ